MRNSCNYSMCSKLWMQIVSICLSCALVFMLSWRHRMHGHWYGPTCDCHNPSLSASSFVSLSVLPSLCSFFLYCFCCMADPFSFRPTSKSLFFAQRRAWGASRLHHEYCYHAPCVLCSCCLTHSPSSEGV